MLSQRKSRKSPTYDTEKRNDPLHRVLSCRKSLSKDNETKGESTTIVGFTSVSKDVVFIQLIVSL